MNTRTMRQRLQRLSFALGLCLLSLPGIAHVFTPDDARDIHEENRRPAPFPSAPSAYADWQQLPKQIESYYADFVRGRTSLLRTNHGLRWQGLGMTPPGSNTFAGSNGWVFFSGNAAWEQHRGDAPWSAAMLHRTCRILRERREMLHARGIAFLFVVAPDKMSIYPEELPDWALPLNAVTPLDQFMAAVRENGLADCVLDLRDALREAKAEQLSYYPYGTHWNAWGAYCGYRAIAAHLSPVGLPPLASDRTHIARGDLNCEWSTSTNDSWGKQWHIEDQMQNPTPWIQLPAELHTLRMRGWWQGLARIQAQPHQAYARQRATPTRLLIFHDSFWEALVPYVTAHFGKTAAVSSYRFDSRLIDAIAPTTVIQLCVERLLQSPFGTDDLARQFERDAGAAASEAYLDHSACPGIYRSPLWDEARVTDTSNGALELAGARIGNGSLEYVQRGIYHMRSPILGRLRLVFLKEGGARHLAITAEQGLETTSFVAEPQHGLTSSALRGWEGHYVHEKAALHVRAAGSALWVFDQLGVLQGVLQPVPNRTDEFRDQQFPDVQWLLQRDGAGTHRLRMQNLANGSPSVEFVRS